MEVQTANRADLDGIVQVHLQAFPGFFMTKLGPSFLREYYRTVMDCSGGILLVALSEASIPAGFVAGFVNPPDFYAQLRSRRFRMLTAALPALIRSPWLLGQMIGNARRVDEATTAADAKLFCELSSIAVSAAARGTGLGKRLVTDFIDHARRRGAESVVLTTDAEDNDMVNRFYQSMAFQVIEAFNAPGDRRMHRYRLALKPAPQRRAA